MECLLICVVPTGVLHKYPNPQATHVVSMDVIDHKYDEETGLLRLERIMGVQQGAPRWIMKVSPAPLPEACHILSSDA